MTKSNLSAKKTQVVFGDDNIVIQKYISGIKVYSFLPSNNSA